MTTPRLLSLRGVASTLAARGLQPLLALSAIGILGRGRFSDDGLRLPRVAGFSLRVLVRWAFVALAAVGMGVPATLALATFVLCGQH